MPKIDLLRTVHAGGKVFFKGEAFVSDEDQKMIEAELNRLEEIEAGQETEEPTAPPKKTRSKSEK